MKWKKPYQEEGDTRMVKRFLFLPTNLDGREYRWLEFATIKQVYCAEKTMYGAIDLMWINVEFVDKK